MPLMSKQVRPPKISSILQKVKIGPKSYIRLFAQKPSIIVTIKSFYNCINETLLIAI